MQNLFTRLKSWFHNSQFFLLPILVYGPYLHLRVVRGHGDEKVYVGQIIEMFQTRHWFEQIQFGRANFIKGPLFYWAGIVGMHVFGNSLWSVLWINLLFAGLACHCLAKVFRSTRLKTWVPFCYLSCVAVIQYQFTAQMEHFHRSLAPLVAAFHTHALAPINQPGPQKGHL